MSHKQLKLKLILFSYFLLGINNTIIAQSSENGELNKPIIVETKDIKNKSGKANVLDSAINYSAKDSIIVDNDKKEIYLYGNAIVKYKNFTIEAGFIKIDEQNKLISATGYKKDSLNKNFVDVPILKEGSEEVAADTILYNYKTEKGKFWQSFSKQDNAYLSSNQLKLFSKKEAFIKDVVYTTCNIPNHPHFGFHITKAKMTDNVIIAGPVYPELLGVPVPILLPFGIFPKNNKRQSGLILPKPGEDSIKGFFLNDFGYYFAFNDYIDLIATSSLYTNGSLGMRLNSRYKKLYKYNGNLLLNFSRQINGEKNTDTYTRSDDYRFTWTHSPINLGQESSFSSNVDIGTSSYFANNVNNIGINDRVNSTLNSSINYSKTWKYTPYSMSISFTHYQNLQTRDINLALPNLNFNVSKFYPFRDINKNASLSVWYKKINASYSANYNNQIYTKDYLLLKPGWQDSLKTGVQQRVPISADLKLFKFFNVNPYVNYTQTWYIKTIEYKYNSSTMAIDTLWNNGFKIANNYQSRISVNTNIYGMKEFKENKMIKAIRHVITPSIRYSFSPSGKKYYREYSYNMGSEIITKYYSIFENSLYAGPSKNASNLLSIDISNNLEIKVPSKTDTSGYTKVPIFEALSFSSGYDFTADTAKLQNFNLNGRTTLFKVVSINFSGYWDPYIYKKRADGYYENTNILRFQDKMWPELRNFNFSVSTSLNSVKLFNNKNPNTLTAEQIQTLKLIDDRPEDFAAFNIPWDFSVNYSYNYNKSPGRPSISNQTLNFSGTLTVTTNFSVKFTSGYDFKNNDIAPTQIGITRNLHCWSLSIDWVPFGYYKSYFITLRANSSMLQDIKITKQQPYYMNEIYH